MRLLLPTVLILLGLALNHAWHGSGCWGLQPGGTISSNLYFAQALFSIYAVLVTLRIFAREIVIRNLLFSIGAVAIGTAAVLSISNSHMHTSVHHQGMENLIPFFSNSLVAIIVGIQVITEPKPSIRLASDCPECGYPLKQLPKKVCPECGYESMQQQHSSSITLYDE